MDHRQTPDTAPYLGGLEERTVHRYPPYFADADADFDASRFVIMGFPYDRTVSYRYGTKLGPDAIRQAAWNQERLNLRNGADFATIPVHDLGNLEISELSPDKMFEAIKAESRRVVQAGKFPIGLGGEHSTSPGLVHALAEKYPDLRIIQLDAHLDYRAEYGGSPHNHACAIARMVDAVGTGRIAGIGIRSAEDVELEAAKKDGHVYYTSFDVEREGIGRILARSMERIGVGPTTPVYITLDIDGIDPAYAPATGTPEPFGLTPWDVLKTITRLGSQLVGFDVNEVSPAWDGGNTAALAARIVREVISEVWMKQDAGA